MTSGAARGVVERSREDARQGPFTHTLCVAALSAVELGFKNLGF